jgi:hypothetical protein
MKKSLFEKAKLVSLALVTTIFGCVAQAATIVFVDVLDTTKIEVSFSGTLSGPVTGTGNIMVDIPISSSFFGPGVSSVIGDLKVGSNLITNAYTGYNNLPFGGTLQLRSGINGENQFASGDLLSGSSILTFTSAHGLQQSWFDGVNAPVYWNAATDTVQGQAGPPAISAVPLPAGGLLLLSGIAGFAGLRRRKKCAK